MNASADTRRGRSSLLYWVGACLLLAIGVFFLWEEHEAHIRGALPYLLIAACPLLHLLMHRAHGGHHPTEHRHDAQRHDVGAKV